MEAKTMSDNSRRTVCRLAFILLCAIPLGLVVYRICHPVTANQWQQAIKAEFGLTAQIGSVETPLPFVTLFHDVKLLDDSGLKQLIHIDELKFIAGATNEIIITHPVQLDASSLAVVSQRLRESLMRTNANSNAWTLTLNEATVVRAGEGFQDYRRLSPIQVSVFPNPEFTDANIEFVCANDGEERRVSVSLHSYRNKSQPHEVFKVNTNSAYLPCWLIQDIWPEVSSFGPLCEFSGYAEFSRLGTVWEGDLNKCHFDSIALNTLAQPFLPVSGIQGLAQASIHNCQIREGKINSLDFVIHCNQDGGTIDKPFAESAEQIFFAKWTGETSFDHLNVQVVFADGNFSVNTQNNGEIASYQGLRTLSLPQSSITVFAKDMAGFLGYKLNPEFQSVNNDTISFLHLFDIRQVRMAEESTVNTEFYR